MIPQLRGANREEQRAAIMQLEAENRRYPDTLVELSIHPMEINIPGRPRRAWRSREFLVQLFDTFAGVLRLSINRTRVDPATMRWLDGITWDELQRLKREAGYGDYEAVEIFPPDANIVDVANIRNLWVLPERLPFSWPGPPA